MAERTDFNMLSDLLQESLTKYNSVWMTIVGKSMLPFLKSGDSIAVRKTDIKDIRVGDVALFRKGDNAIAHRVIRKIRRNGRFFLQAKSDISFASESFGSEELIGKAVSFKKGVKEIGVDNMAFRLMGLAAAFIFPFIARTLFIFKSLNGNVIRT